MKSKSRYTTEEKIEYFEMRVARAKIEMWEAQRALAYLYASLAEKTGTKESGRSLFRQVDKRHKK